MASNGFRSLEHAVYLREVHVTEQGRNHTALRNALSARRVRHHSQEPQHRVIANPTGHLRQYDVMLGLIRFSGRLL